MKSLRIFLSCVLIGMGFLFISFEGFAQETEFYQASQLYKEGKYEQAITQYENILKTGKTSGALYYNLGNSYYKNGQIGKAIINYMRAKRLLPRDSDVDFNYRYVRSQVKHPFDIHKQGILKKIISPYAGHFTLDEIFMIVLVSYALLCVFILLGLFLQWQRKTIIMITGFMGFILLLNVSIFIYQHNEYRHTAVAITDIDSKFEPTEKGTTHFHLLEGSSMTVLDKEEDWIKIKRIDGKVGWVKSEKVERL